MEDHDQPDLSPKGIENMSDADFWRLGTNPANASVFQRARDIHFRQELENIRNNHPEFFGRGTIDQVLTQCKTPQQKAALLLRLTEEANQDPRFIAFTAELQRIASAPQEQKPANIPNDIYRDILDISRELKAEKNELATLLATETDRFIALVVRSGLVQTSREHGR